MEFDESALDGKGGSGGKRVFPQFFIEAIKLTFRSEQEGRPIFEDREMVKVIIPGDRNSQPVYEVTDEHRQRWPKEYAAFKKGMEPVFGGTPLKEWPKIGPSQISNLNHFNIFTVEQLAELGDNVLGNLGMGARDLRKSAQMWLEVAKNGSAPIERMLGENQRLRDEVERLKADNADLLQRLEAAVRKPSRKGVEA